MTKIMNSLIKNLIDNKLEIKKLEELRELLLSRLASLEN